MFSSIKNFEFLFNVSKKLYFELKFNNMCFMNWKLSIIKFIFTIQMYLMWLHFLSFGWWVIMYWRYNSILLGIQLDFIKYMHKIFKLIFTVLKKLLLKINFNGGLHWTIKSKHMSKMLWKKLLSNQWEMLFIRLLF